MAVEVGEKSASCCTSWRAIFNFFFLSWTMGTQGQLGLVTDCRRQVTCESSLSLLAEFSLVCYLLCFLLCFFLFLFKNSKEKLAGSP